MSEIVEASMSDRRNERNTSPPSAMRRDDRAESDDDEGVSSSRIDVVNVDGARSDSAANGMVSLRRELAKLHQQAAAVEKSLEDQRRDRTESLDRLERATERALTLEARCAHLESETTSLRKMHEASLADLQTVRAERDDLARAVEAAKAATSELGALKDEITELRARAEDATRKGGELSRAKDEVAEAAEEAKRAKADAEKARKALDVAEQDAAMVSGQASKIREEAEKIRVEAEKLREEAASARAEAEKAREEAAKAREDAEKTREDAANARAELEKAREQDAGHTGELAKAREDAETVRQELAKAREDQDKRTEELAKARDDQDKRTEELAKAREDLARAKEDNTRDRSTARDRIDLLDRALDDARATTSRTESELEAARGNEDRLTRQLEAALARASQAESNALTAAMAHAALENSVRILRDEISGAFARVEQQALALGGEPAATAAEAEAALAEQDPSVTSSPASKSVPPPAPSIAPAAPPGSIPPPMYASVPPQVHASAPPPPAGGQKTLPPPPAHVSVPPQAIGTMPPPARTTASPPKKESLPPADGWNNDSSPPTRRPGSAMPPPYHELADLTSRARQDLLAKLVDPDNAEEAAMELRQHPEWLRSVPPPALIAALSSVDYDAEGTLFDLARAWDREPLCHSIIASLRAEKDPRAREHCAWLLKHLAAPSSWKAIADIAKNDDEPTQLRRWLLEALDRLAAGRAIGWRELGDVVTSVARHPDPLLRDGVVGVLVSLDRSDEKRRLLLDILRADDDEVVLASAVNALASVLPMELDPGLVERLLGHPSARVQRSVRDLIERAKQTK